MTDDPDLTAAVAERLKMVRSVLNVRQVEFGARAGLSATRYNSFETGRRLLTLEAALALCNEYRLSMDFLYRGDVNGLPYELADAIIKLKRLRSVERSHQQKRDGA